MPRKSLTVPFCQPAQDDRKTEPKAEAETGRERHRASRQIDGFHFPHIKATTRNQPVDRTDSAQQAHIPRNHFGQHRLQHKAVFPIHHRNLDSRIPPLQPLQMHRRIDGAKSAAQTHDSHPLAHVRSTATTQRGDLQFVSDRQKTPRRPPDHQTAPTPTDPVSRPANK